MAESSDGSSGSSGSSGSGGGGSGMIDLGINSDQDNISQSKTTSGFFDASVTNNFGGLNVPQYPDFASLNVAPLSNAIKTVDNVIWYAAIAGLGLAWIINR